jgi:hypothetical protein
VEMKRSYDFPAILLVVVVMTIPSDSVCDVTLLVYDVDERLLAKLTYHWYE